jgi:hypothetical protein
MPNWAVPSGAAFSFGRSPRRLAEGLTKVSPKPLLHTAYLGLWMGATMGELAFPQTIVWQSVLARLSEWQALLAHKAIGNVYVMFLAGLREECKGFGRG